MLYMYINSLYITHILYFITYICFRITRIYKCGVFLCVFVFTINNMTKPLYDSKSKTQLPINTHLFPINYIIYVNNVIIKFTHTQCVHTHRIDSSYTIYIIFWWHNAMLLSIGVYEQTHKKLLLYYHLYIYIYIYVIVVTVVKPVNNWNG